MISHFTRNQRFLRRECSIRFPATRGASCNGNFSYRKPSCGLQHLRPAQEPTTKLSQSVGELPSNQRGSVTVYVLANLDPTAHRSLRLE